jgi:hypothetical protein
MEPVVLKLVEAGVRSTVVGMSTALKVLMPVYVLRSTPVKAFMSSNVFTCRIDRPKDPFRVVLELTEPEVQTSRLRSSELTRALSSEGARKERSLPVVKVC